LLTLQFAAVGAGSGSFSWNENRLFDATGRLQSGSQWLAGTVQVVQ
jgi:hypothetical protein